MNATEPRRVVRFVRRLIAAGSAAPTDDGFAARGDGRPARIDRPTARRLVAAGLVEAHAGQLRPTAEARTWLRRHLADADRFADQHRDIRRAPDGTRINQAESPLRKLASLSSGSGKPFLLPHHLEAGERVRRLVERAALAPRTTTNYTPDHVASQRADSAGAGAAISDMASDARRRLARLGTDLPPDSLGVVIDVCGFLKGLQQVESERGWPQRSAKLVLRIGLDQVAHTFGLMPFAEGRASAPTRRWRQGPRPPMFEEG